MKKISKIMFGLFAIVTLAACGKGNGEKQLGYNSLKKLATERAPSVNISVSLTNLPGVTSDMTFPFEGAPIASVYDSSTGKYVLTDISDVSFPAVSVYKTGTIASGLFYYVVDHGTSVGEYDVVILNADSEKIETFAITSSYLTLSFSGANSFEYEDVWYQSIKYQDGLIGDDKYLYFSCADVYKSITYEVFKEKNDLYYAETYSSKLKAFKDFGIKSPNYFISDSVGMSIYKENGNFLGSIPSSTWGSSTSSFTADNGMMYYYGFKIQDEIVGKNVVEIYNSFRYEVDTRTASWNYKDHLPYVINEHKEYYDDDDNYIGAILTVTPLSDDLTVLLPYVECREVIGDLEKATTYAYDQILKSTFVKAGNTVLAYRNGEVHKITSTGRKIVEHARSIVSADSKEVLYIDYNGDYNLAKVSEFGKKDILPSYEYISWNKFNGQRMIIEWNGENLLLNSGDNKVGIYDYWTSYGLIASDSKVWVIGGTDVFNYSKNVSEIDYIATVGDSKRVFKVTLADGSSKFFLHTAR